MQLLQDLLNRIAWDPELGKDRFAAHFPLHRVRTVYKNGEAIWRRPVRSPRD